MVREQRSGSKDAKAFVLTLYVSVCCRTPGEAMQAEDRVRRIGQTKPVKSIWMSAFELDQQIDTLLEQKSQTTNAVLSSNSSTGNSSAPKLSIFQMLQKVLPSHVDGLRQTSMPQFSQGAR